MATVFWNRKLAMAGSKQEILDPFHKPFGLVGLKSLPAIGARDLFLSPGTGCVEQALLHTLVPGHRYLRLSLYRGWCP